MSFNGCLTPAGGEKKNRGCFFADNVKEVSGIQAHMEMKPLDLTARVRAVTRHSTTPSKDALRTHRACIGVPDRLRDAPYIDRTLP